MQPLKDVKLDATDLRKIHEQQFQQRTILNDAVRSSTAAGGSKNPMVEAFILENPPIEPHAAAALLALSPEQQIMVIQRGSLAGARNPTAVLMGRIRAMKTGQASGISGGSGGKGSAHVDFLLSRISAKDKSSRSRSRSSSSSSSRSRKKKKHKKKKRKKRKASSSSSSCVVVVENEGKKKGNAASSSRSDVQGSADEVLNRLLAQGGT